MEEKLIEEVRKYEFLYNVHSKDYRDQRKRQEAWEAIGEKINKNGLECKDGWTKLRNAYTNALKRRKTTSGQATKKILKWKFEDQMSFLSPYMEPRLSQSSFQSQNEHNVDSEIEENDKNMTNDVETQDEEDGDGDQTTRTSSSSVPKASTYLNAHGNPNVLSSTRTTGKKRIEKSMTELVDIMKSNNRMRSQIMQPPAPPAEQSKVPDDDMELFFLSLAKSVKKLPSAEQIRLKMGISNLVFEAELRNITRGAILPHPSPLLSSSTNSYSNDSETFLQSSSAEHYFSHHDENLQSTSTFLVNTEGSSYHTPT